MQQDLQKFSSQADPAILAQMKEIARKEGVQFQYALSEALRDWVEKKKQLKPRDFVMAHARAVMDEHAHLLKLLSK